MDESIPQDLVVERWGVGLLRENIDAAIHEIKDLFSEEMADCLEPRKERLVATVNLAFAVYSDTLDIYKDVPVGGWRFWKKETVRRRVIQITNPYPYDTLTMLAFGLRCELFLNDSRLRDIAQRVLDPLVERFNYLPAEYIDRPSEWYLGEERPELPKARLLNG